MADDTKFLTRRNAIRTAIFGVLGLVGLKGISNQNKTFWQIDPSKCVKCGKCETDCVKQVSAVTCVHQYESCGYCDFCSGFYNEDRTALDTSAQNLLCPRDALKRKFIEEPYFEYQVDSDLCTACGKCVKGCSDFGNGSLFLQVNREDCLNCNECTIAKVCPSDAFVRVDETTPYIYKKAVF